MKKQKILFQIEAQSKDVGNEDPIFVLEDPDDKDQIFFSFDQKTNICGHMSNKNDFLNRFQDLETNLYFCEHKSCKTDYNIKYNTKKNYDSQHLHYAGFEKNDLTGLIADLDKDSKARQSREIIKYMLFFKKIEIEDVIFQFRINILWLAKEEEKFRNKANYSDSLNKMQSDLESGMKKIVNSLSQLLLSFIYYAYDSDQANKPFDMISMFINEELKKSGKKIANKSMQETSILKFFKEHNTIIHHLIIFLFDIEYDYLKMSGNKNLILDGASRVAKRMTIAYCKFLFFNDIDNISSQDITSAHGDDLRKDNASVGVLEKFYRFLNVSQYIKNENYDEEILKIIREETLNSIEFTYGSFLKHLADEKKRHRNYQISHELMEICFEKMFVEILPKSSFVSENRVLTSFLLASIPQALTFFAKNIDFANQKDTSFFFQKNNDKDIFDALKLIYNNDKDPVYFGYADSYYKLSKFPLHTNKDIKSLFQEIGIVPFPIADVKKKSVQPKRKKQKNVFCFEVDQT